MPTILKILKLLFFYDFLVKLQLNFKFIFDFVPVLLDAKAELPPKIEDVSFDTKVLDPPKREPSGGCPPKIEDVVNTGLAATPKGKYKTAKFTTLSIICHGPSKMTLCFC